MKRRACYVSISSSSSFVVVPFKIRKNARDGVHANENDLGECFDEDRFHDGLLEGGETEFGWQNRQYSDTESKWNWLVLQAAYADRDGESKYRAMLDDYIHEVNPVLSIDWNAIYGKFDTIDAYIDHQSVDPNGTFDEIEEIGITEWLLNWDCFIQNGNDNE